MNPEHKTLEGAMTGREIYNILVHCPHHFKVVTKVYRGLEWLKNDAGVVGFLCKVNSNLGKTEKLEKIRAYCAKAKLPVKIINIDHHLTEFKIVIVK